ncbi:MAG: cyclic pyranopterin monophosphate synthase MoaC [Calditrichaeota bacterium]|nr:MAG: cyclic pyranopterin monophosphate synthase MoaC [Calditrichota bacterium]
MKKNELSHVREDGTINMVDIGTKKITTRRAVALGSIKMAKTTIHLLRENALKKGDAIQTAKIAGIMAAKKTSEIIPLCHPILLSKIDVEMTVLDECVNIKSTVVCDGKTGVEMEALTACSIAALTIYDMCKAVDKNMVIGDIKLVHKSGGKSGDFDLE